MIRGERQKVVALRDAIEKYETRGGTPLWQLAEHFGIDYEKRSICVRGEVYFYDFDDLQDDEYPVLTVCTETAWCACHDLFEALNKELGGELSISWREIEPGCEIYSVYDEGDWFPEEAIVTAWGEPFGPINEDAYLTVDAAIDFWCEMMHEDRQGRTTEQMMEVIENYKYKSDDTYFAIHEITFE
jgi:hypothetical protein